MTKPREYKVLVPVAFQDGTELPQEIIDRLAKTAVELFGGLTIESPASGYWKNAATQELVEETMIPWVIAHNKYEEVIAFARLVRYECNQVCVYLRTPNNIVEFIT